MLNFEEELKNYEPSLEIDEAESAIYSHDLTDVTDIIAEILRGQQKQFLLGEYKMICYKCGQETGWEDSCPACGADMKIFKKVVRISN